MRDGMATITLDGRQVEARQGENLLLVALEQGVHIPHLCFHPALSAPAGCRLCLVEVEGATGWEMVTACDTRIVDGMVVNTEGEKVAQARAAVLEFALLNHPLNCPVCDKAGECELQEYVHAHGRAAGRFNEEKLTRGRKVLGKGVLLHAERCIGCTRCVRFCDEITGTSELGIFARGAHVELDVFPGRELGNELAGNVVDLCPVGALIDGELAAAPPAWKLKGVDSICPGCSAGCNIRVDVHRGRMYRLKPRVNPEVNRYWMCDDGRYGWRYVHAEQRLGTPRCGRGTAGRNVSWDEAIREASQRLVQQFGPESIAVICSGFQTNEESFLLARLAVDLWRTHQLALWPREDGRGDVEFADGFTLRGDRSPNARGLREVAAGMGLELLSGELIWSRIERGEIRALLLLGGGDEEELEERVRRGLEQLEWLVVVDILDSELTRLADVVLPGVSAFEKEGSFTNVDGRVQRVRRAIPPLAGAMPDWQILQKLGEEGGVEWHYKSTPEITAEIGQLLEGGYTDTGDGDRVQGSGSGQAYGGGWVDWLQRCGFFGVGDHTKSSH